MITDYIIIDKPKAIDSKEVAAQVKALIKGGKMTYEIGLIMEFCTTDPKAILDKFQVLKNHIAFAHRPIV